MGLIQCECGNEYDSELRLCTRCYANNEYYMEQINIPAHGINTTITKEEKNSISSCRSRTDKNQFNILIIVNIIFVLVYACLLYIMLSGNGNPGNRYILSRSIGDRYHIAMLYPLIAFILSFIGISKKSIWSMP